MATGALFLYILSVYLPIFNQCLLSVISVTEEKVVA